mmetsp:Transcript_16789/g.14724  ORF Transcript_16789/g.14724 Transcript_16789/m.14724 type:complete len:165 (+) Transcript_16789:313-807(+)
MFKFPDSKLNINNLVSFCSKIISKNIDYIPNHRQKCLLPLLDQDSYNRIYSNAEIYIVLNEVDSTTVTEKLEVGCIILDAIASADSNIEAFIINNNTPIIRPFEAGVMRDLLHTRIYLIDTSKISGKNIVTMYPEFKIDHLKFTLFLQQFLEEREDDFDYKLDL